MATAYFTVGSKFRPYTLAEMIVPYQMYKQEYDAISEGLAELDTKAGVWENIANEQTDPTAYTMYKTYADDLRKQADVLATQGLTPGARQNLLKMRGRYSQEIIPIENAYNTRKTLAEEQRKLRTADPTLRFQRDMATTSLDDFLANPQLDYGSSYSGAFLTKQVAEAAANLKNEMRNNPRYWRPILGDQYYETVMTTGFTSDEVNKAIFDPENANPILVNLVDRVMDGSGISEWASKDVYNQLRDYANHGLYSAVGETKYETLQNRNFMSDYEKWKARKEREKNTDSYTYPDQYRSASYQREGILYRQASEDLKMFEDLSPEETIHIKDYSGNYSVNSRVDATKIMKEYNTKKSEFEDRFKKELGFDFKIPGYSGSAIIKDDDGSTIEITEGMNNTFTVRRAGARTMSNSGMPSYEKDQRLTDLYNKYYKEYKKLETEMYLYKDSGIEDLAFTDKELEKFRETYNIPEDTEITEYADFIRNNPESKLENRNYIEVDVAGNDGKAYRDALTAIMCSNLISQSKGAKLNKMSLQSIPTNGSGVYILDDRFEHDSKPEKFKDIFTFDDEGNINNINNYKLTPQSIANGNLIATVIKNNKAINVEIPFEYFGNEVASVLYSENPISGVSYKDSMKYYIEQEDWNSAEILSMNIGNQIAKLVNYNRHTRQGETMSIKE